MSDRWEDWFEQGERLLWEGAPEKGIHHPVRNVLMTAVGLPFFIGGCAVCWSGIAMGLSFLTVWSVIGALGLMAFSVPFLGIGAGLISGPWVQDFLKHKRIRYALSDRAGYIATRWWDRKMNVLPLTAGTRVDYDEGLAGTGSVWFDFETTIDNEGDRSTKKRGFEDIADARMVYTMIREASALRPEAGS